MFRQGCGFFLYYLLNQNGVSHLGRPIPTLWQTIHYSNLTVCYGR
jgi:hypothetical protein